ncbi:hypothetical protein L218DRAFT_113139 [Marasmius fiardii PR-910]|nr:hypothetical protein L218DRAFT_113139 [Marasmius fiardii PR-910]
MNARVPRINKIKSSFQDCSATRKFVDSSVHRSSSRSQGIKIFRSHELFRPHSNLLPHLPQSLAQTPDFFNLKPSLSSHQACWTCNVFNSFSNFQLHAPQAHTPQTILLRSLAQGKAFLWRCCSRRLVCSVIRCGLSTVFTANEDGSKGPPEFPGTLRPVSVLLSV